MLLTRRVGCIVVATLVLGASTAVGQEQSSHWMEAAARAALGVWYASGSVTYRDVSFPHFPGVHFIVAAAPGPHSVVEGLIGELPSGQVVPLGCPVTRRMLADFARLVENDSLDAVGYAVELAKLDGVIPARATLVTNSDSVPPGQRSRIVDAGIRLARPSYFSRDSGELVVTFYAWADALFRVRVVITDTREMDYVYESKVLLGSEGTPVGR